MTGISTINLEGHDREGIRLCKIWS